MSDTIYTQQSALPGREIKWLNSYTGYFPSSDGDLPLTVVAGSIYEACKLLMLPGMIAPESIEPITVKYGKSKVATAIPVRQVSFDTIIDPNDAKLAGATATPVHYDVNNGDNVIFSASEPFGFKFSGWYKEGVESALSTAKVANIEVFEPNKSYTKFIARYAQAYRLRSGRYMDLNRGTIWALTFERYSVYQGRCVLNPDGIDAYYGGIDDLSGENGAPGKMSVVVDSTISQTSSFVFKVAYNFTPVGLNFVIENVSLDNPYGFEKDDVINLKYLNE